MKNFFPVLCFAILCVMAVSCSENNIVEDVNADEISFLTKEQLAAVKISSAKVYSPTHKEYNKLTHGIASKANAQFASTGKSKVAYGDFFVIADNMGSKLSILTVGGGGSSREFVLEMNGVTRVLRVNEVANHAEGVPSFSYEVTDMSGKVLSQSARTNGWWDCVSDEFNDICNKTVIRSIVCAAGAAACPECGAVLLGGLMLSCANIF